MQRFETHLSEVVVAGDFAWKRKKPVRFSFVDFSTLALRERFCRDEVQVNRRLAPAIYLGVAPLHRTRAGELTLGDFDPMGGVAPPAGIATAAPWATLREPAAPIVDWCVAMRRLPAAGMLDAVVARGEFDAAAARALAETLARFHHAARIEAPAERLAASGVPALSRRQQQLIAEARAAAAVLDRRGVAPPVLPPALATALATAGERFLDVNAERLARRLAAGAIVDGHGDLHCANLCVVDGVALPFDAIEFDPALRRGDVAADLAFLTMDLRRRGAAPAAAALVEAYVAASGDRELPALLPWYEAQRAVVRGNVAALRAAQAGGESAADEARAAWAFAALTGGRAPLVALCGLQGSGKSRLARALSARLGGVVLEADVLRKQIAGLPVDAPAPPERRAELYAPEAIERVYRELLARAEAPLAAGRTVLLDATWSTAARRSAAAALARRCNAPFFVVHCRADERTIEARLLRRAGEPGQASDADLAVYRAARDRFEPPTEVAPPELVEFTAADGALDDPRDAVLAGPLGRLIVALARGVGVE